MYLCIKVANFFVRKYKIEKIFVQRYYKCMTNQNKNSVRDSSNAVLVRSEADSNRCRRFCRPLVKPLAHRTNSDVITNISVITERKDRKIFSISKIFCENFYLSTKFPCSATDYSAKIATFVK